MQNSAVEHFGSGTEHYQRQEDNRRKQRIEKQNGNDGVILQRLLLEGIVTAQQGC
jgi:hypothetical protein